jgi:glycosyltransferase involved in cell wall biosynthesis
VIGPKGSRDGLPNVLLEAMASGLACVGSAVASIPEVIQNGQTGLLVPPGNAVALADALARLIEDTTLRHRLGERAAELVRQSFGRVPAMDRLHGQFLLLHETHDPEQTPSAS